MRGYGVIWGQKNEFGEKFVKGAFAKSIREHGPGSNAPYQIKFIYNHRTCDPLSLFAILKEDDIGLYFETVPLDPIDVSDKVLVQLRSGTLNNFSLGFNFVWDRVEWDDADDSLVVLEGILYEISVVTIPADMETYAARSIEDMGELNDDIEDYIDQLPRKFRLEARALFARQKSLVDLDSPLQHRAKAPNEAEPVAQGINYNYLLNNLNSL